MRIDPWARKIPLRKKWQPTPVFWPGQSHGQRSLVGYRPWGHKESDTTERLSTHTHTHTHTHTRILSSQANFRNSSSCTSLQLGYSHTDHFPPIRYISGRQKFRRQLCAVATVPKGSEHLQKILWQGCGPFRGLSSSGTSVSRLSFIRTDTAALVCFQSSPQPTTRPSLLLMPSLEPAFRHSAQTTQGFGNT